MSLKELCAYETPSVAEMQNFLLADRWPTGHVNQVWPNVYIGNEIAARDKSMLYNMDHTHCERYMDIDYYGVEADDSSDFILSVFFYPTQQGLYELKRVFAHCLMGVSCSATLVLAFLMICEDLTLMEAIKAVRQHRDICPNLGFLNQLRHLDMSLVRERKKKLEAYKLRLKTLEQCDESHFKSTPLKGLLPHGPNPVLLGQILFANIHCSAITKRVSEGKIEGFHHK
uniref:Dual specificity phosphatase 13a n=1 Tax=Cyprinus carpio carpio TaxID=630221 RepID=A0A9J7ZB13_CYPCA